MFVFTLKNFICYHNSRFIIRSESAICKPKRNTELQISARLFKPERRCFSLQPYGREFRQTLGKWRQVKHKIVHALIFLYTFVFKEN